MGSCGPAGPGEAGGWGTVSCVDMVIADRHEKRFGSDSYSFLAGRVLVVAGALLEGADEGWAEATLKFACCPIRGRKERHAK